MKRLRLLVNVKFGTLHFTWSLERIKSHVAVPQRPTALRHLQPSNLFQLGKSHSTKQMMTLKNK